MGSLLGTNWRENLLEQGHFLCIFEQQSAMAKQIHEIRDPLYGFIHLTTEERRVLNSRPVQRLRNIHQLGLTYLVFPSATHRRFEHSLGVMEIATKVFDTVTAAHRRHPKIEDFLPELASPEKVQAGRTVVRMAALCHDLGHLPFSHAGEQLLPAGTFHEELSKILIESEEMQELWEQLPSRPRAEDIAKIALGPDKFPAPLTDWERILSEIVTGDVLGADRMDYLLRDAYHSGVGYGRFDHLRLVEGIRLLPQPADGEQIEVIAPALGIEEGSMAAAESLLLARRAMFTQVYHHHVPLAYNRHLQDFLSAWLPGGQFERNVAAHLSMDDNRVLTAMQDCAGDRSPAGAAADRILRRKHFKRLYSVGPNDRRSEDPLENVETLESLTEAIAEEFGEENVRYFRKPVRGGKLDFPVHRHNNQVISSLKISEILSRLPEPMIEVVFIEPSLHERALRWLNDHQSGILAA